MRIATSSGPIPPQPPKQPKDNGNKEPNEPTPPPLSEETRDQLLESLVTNNDFMKRVKSGEEVSLSVDGKEVVKITRTGPSTAERMVKGFQVGIRATTEEINQFMENDPLISFRTVAMGVKTQIYGGIPTELQELGEKAFLPMVRVAALGFDANKTMKMFRDKEARGVEKAIEVGHLITDVVGVVGAFAPFIPIPAIQNNATKLVAVGFAGDIVACATRVASWARNRSENTDPGRKN